MAAQASISIRPVAIVAQTFTDGESVFEHALLTPTSAWGIFIDSSSGTTSGLVQDRETAIATAAHLAQQNGWKIVHIAAEGDGLQQDDATLQ